MAIDLTTMSRKELLKLRDDVEKELTLVEERERKEALKAAQDVAAQYGYSLSELAEAAGKKGRGKGKRSKTGPKYRNPDDAEQTWSGLGRKPQWFHDALANGVDRKDLEI